MGVTIHAFIGREVHGAPLEVVMLVAAGRHQAFEHRLQIIEQERFVFVDHHARGRVQGLQGQQALADPETLDQCDERRRQVDELGGLARDD